MNISLKSIIATSLLSTALLAHAAPTNIVAANAPAQGTAAQTNTIESLVRAGMNEYLSLWTHGPAQTSTTVLHQDATLQYSLSVPEMHGAIEGRDSLVNHVAAVAQLGTAWRFDDIKLFATNDPNAFFVQYTAHGTLLRSGESFERPAIVVIETDGTRVTRIQELSNPAIAQSSAVGDATRGVARSTH